MDTQEQMYLVMNQTDGIQAHFDMVTEDEGKQIIADFPKRYERQGGMYRTASGERIPATQVVLELVPCDVDDEDMDEDVRAMIEGE